MNLKTVLTGITLGALDAMVSLTGVLAMDKNAASNVNSNSNVEDPIVAILRITEENKARIFDTEVAAVKTEILQLLPENLKNEESVEKILDDKSLKTLIKNVSDLKYDLMEWNETLRQTPADAVRRTILTVRMDLSSACARLNAVLHGRVSDFTNSHD